MENYTNNQTTDLTRSLKVSSSVVAVKVAVMVVLDVVASLGNILVCCSVYKNPRLRTKTGFLILALSMSDLLFALVVVPLSTASIARTNRYRNRPLWISKDIASPGCIVQGNLFYSLMGMSLTTLAFAAVNRYLCVVHSHFYRKYFTFKMIGVCLVLMFLSIQVLIICIGTTKLGRFEFVAEFAVCMLLFVKSQKDAQLYVQIVIVTIWGVLPFFIIIVSYSLIYRNVRQHSRQVGFRLAQHALKSKTTNTIENEIKSVDAEEIRKHENKNENHLVKMNDKTCSTALTSDDLIIESLESADTDEHRKNNPDKTTASSSTKIPNIPSKGFLRKKIISTRKRDLNKTKQSAAEAKATKIMLLVFIGFCSSFIPALISLAIHTFSNRSHLSNDITIVVIYSGALSVAINPIIYGVANRDFRKTYIAMLTRKPLQDQT